MKCGYGSKGEAKSAEQELDRFARIRPRNIIKRKEVSPEFFFLFDHISYLLIEDGAPAGVEITLAVNRQHNAARRTQAHAGVVARTLDVDLC